MGTQRIITLALTLALAVGGIIYLRNQSNPEGRLRICTWSNYFPKDILEKFTAETGIKVELSFISSNEELFAKLKAGATGFDIIQPSDYMVRQLSALKMLKTLDASQLTYLSHIDEYFRTLNYDPQFKVSVPFTWGTTGIALNTKKVKIPADGVSWKMLLESADPKHTSLLDDMREVFAAVFYFKGLNPNTKRPEDLKLAQTTIAQSKDGVLMFTSEPKPLLLKGELNIAHVFSVDAVQAHQDNPDIQYFIPKEGGTLWTDNLAIPSTSAHEKQAHIFINYFLNPENAAVIARENSLATPNKTAKLLLPKEMQANPGLYPSPEQMKKLHMFDDMGEALNEVHRLWTELKS